jgi:D-amino-acid dehydrogenase
VTSPQATTGAGPQQPDEPDVLVIGAGIVGLFCAYHLSRRGLRVTVLERGQVGGAHSCSSGNTGFVGTQGAQPLAQPALRAHGLHRLWYPDSPMRVRLSPDPQLWRWLWQFRQACGLVHAQAGFQLLLELKRRSLAILRDLCAGGPLADRFRAPGMVVAFRSAPGFAAACAEVPAAVAGGVPLRVLGGPELAQLCPGVDFDICGALYNEEGAYLELPAFVQELAAELERRQVRIVPHTEVTGFTVKGDRLIAVHTRHRRWRPTELVIAAGSWSSACARLLGLRLMLQPVTGHALTMPAPPRSPRLPIVLGEARIAVAPLDDRIRFAGSLELAGMDGRVRPDRVRAMLAAVRSYLPGLESRQPVQTWTGLRPCTPDSLPLLGRSPRHRNVWVSCGHGHIGMGLAPATGELLADLVSGQAPRSDVRPLRVDRFDRAATARPTGRAKTSDPAQRPA